MYMKFVVSPECNSVYVCKNTQRVVRVFFFLNKSERLHIHTRARKKRKANILRRNGEEDDDDDDDDEIKNQAVKTLHCAFGVYLHTQNKICCI